MKKISTLFMAIICISCRTDHNNPTITPTPVFEVIEKKKVEAESNDQGNFIWKILRGSDGNFYIALWDSYAVLDASRNVIPLKKPYTNTFNCGTLDIAEDLDGNQFWFATENGIMRYKDSTASFYPIAGIEQSTRVNSIYVDSGNKKWAGTYGAGVFSFDDSGVVQYTTAEGLNSDYVYALFKDADGIVWIGTGEGINKLENNVITNVTIDVSDPSEQPIVNKIIKDPLSSDLWMSSNQGIIRKQGNNFVFEKDSTGHNVYATGDFQFDSKGNVWFSSTAGLFFYDRKSVTGFDTSDGLELDYIMSLFVEDDQTIWAGTWGKGIDIIQYHPVPQ